MSPRAWWVWASTAIWTFGRDLLTTVGRLSDTASAVAWVFLGAVGTLGAAARDVGHRFGLRKSWRLAMLLMALGTALFAVFPHFSGIAWFGAAAFGLTYIGLTSLLLIWGTNVYPYSPASGVGIAFLVIALGQAVGSPLMGMIAGAFDLRVAFLFAAGVAVIGAFIKPVSARRSRTRTDVPTQVRDIA
ncbi:MAG: YbfB/YjiJ family MFS transporter [Micrococcaceae bacterium]|nr:YbfB/YjiJ family MFS transporter [Micrococcaceae bacterium]